MMARFQRLNAMIKQARLPAPDHHIAMLQQQTLQRIAALQPAKLKDGRHPSETETIGARRSCSSLS